MSPRVRTFILRAGGALLLLLGGLHLAVTRLLARLVEQSASADAALWLVPPMLLNHIVVGILLLPLGGLTLYAAPHAAAGVRWAVVIVRATALTVAALPPVIFLIMGTRYFAARPFRLAVLIACAAAVALVLAAFWPPAPGASASPPCTAA